MTVTNTFRFNDAVHNTNVANIHYHGPWKVYAKNGQKANAIKDLCELTGRGLKESKDVVELYEQYAGKYDAEYTRSKVTLLDVSIGGRHVTVRHGENGKIVADVTETLTFVDSRSLIQYIYELGLRNGQPTAS